MALIYKYFQVGENGYFGGPAQWIDFLGTPVDTVPRTYRVTAVGGAANTQRYGVGNTRTVPPGSGGFPIFLQAPEELIFVFHDVTVEVEQQELPPGTGWIPLPQSTTTWRTLVAPQRISAQSPLGTFPPNTNSIPRITSLFTAYPNTNAIKEWGVVGRTAPQQSFGVIGVAGYNVSPVEIDGIEYSNQGPVRYPDSALVANFRGITGPLPDFEYSIRVTFFVVINGPSDIAPGFDKTFELQVTDFIARTPALPAPPTNVSPPVVTGTASVGQVLSCSTGTWTGAEL